MSPSPAPDDKVSVLTDDDSFGPAPPPPDDPHPEDQASAGSASVRREFEQDDETGVQIDGIEDALNKKPSEDPPGDVSVDEEEALANINSDENQELLDGSEEEQSVEIPPTTVVQRMLAKEQMADEKDSNRWMMASVVVCCCLVIAAIILGVGFGTGSFTNSPSDPVAASPEGARDAPTTGDATPPSLERPAAIASYLAAGNTDGFDAFNDPESASAQSLNWLINDDPLALDPATNDHQWRLNQRYALLNLWFASQERWKTETNWLDSQEECDWYGVTCEQVEMVEVNQDTGAETAVSHNIVTAVELENNKVQALPADISMLKGLRSLKLPRNNLRGPLPASLWTLTELRELDLSENKVKQDMSDVDWSTVPNLQVVRFGNNQLRGRPADSLYELENLRELDLSGNGLTGALPLGVTQLPNLEVLSLGNNEFNGGIPEDYASFPALKQLNIQSNLLTGNVLQGLGGSQLTALYLGDNQYQQAAMPDYIYDMEGLEVLSLKNSRLEGALNADGIAKLTKLRELDLDANFLTGSVSSLPETLEVVSVRNNLLTGSLDFLSSLPNLRQVDVASNSFTSALPDLSGSKIERLQAQGNDLGGAFPEALTSSDSLVYLDLSNTGMTGELPASLDSMKAIEQIRLHGNALEGGIPANLPASLVVLKLEDNNLNGELPEFSYLIKLEILELQNNRFSGPIPETLPPNLRTVRINSNYNQDTDGSGFSGGLPESLGSLGKLEILEVYGNQLNGPIPASLGDMINLQYLDLEFNGLTGEVPAELGNLANLEEFYLSNNQLEGAIPDSVCKIPTLRFMVPDCSVKCGCCSTCM